MEAAVSATLDSSATKTTRFQGRRRRSGRFEEAAGNEEELWPLWCVRAACVRAACVRAACACVRRLCVCVTEAEETGVKRSHLEAAQGGARLQHGGLSGPSPGRPTPFE